MADSVYVAWRYVVHDYCQQVR